MKYRRAPRLTKCLDILGRARFHRQDYWRLGPRRIGANGYAVRDLFRGGVRYGRISEHRAVMEGLLGRPLSKTETVHHINEVRADNRGENLALASNVAAHRWCHTEESKIFLRQGRA